ncbi:MAG: MFS transporter [Chloroflexota bacterium]
MLNQQIRHLKHNLTVNLLDGAFFGFGLGFASFVTIIPLFVSTMTDSALLIGLIPAIHNAGWQFPQLFTARWVSRQPQMRRLVLNLTFIERTPFLGLALVAGFMTALGKPLALVITFVLLIIQGLGAGVTANPWTSMIGKIIPSDRRSTFFGVQAAASNALASLSAFAAGVILEKLPSPLDFVLCFLACVLAMVVSWVFLYQTREEDNQPANDHPYAAPSGFWSSVGEILQRDRNFRWFLVARMVSQFAIMAFSFYTVYAVKRHAASEIVVGGMTTTLLVMSIAGNMTMGWASDQWSRKGVMQVGLAAAALSALLAWWAPSAGWFYVVYALAALGNVAVWTIGIAMSLEFGDESQRTAYIGLANTLVAPANILAPFVGGWLADLAGYPAAFMLSAAGAVSALLIFQFFVSEPQQARPAAVLQPSPGGE